MFWEITFKSIGFAALIAMFGFGTFVLTDYSSRPAPTGEILENLEHLDDSQFILNRRDNESTVVLFYHPHCPCTFATARCLQRLSTDFKTRPQIIALAYCPEDQPDRWIESSTTRQLKKIADVRVVIDRDGSICQQFGVTTSGHTLIYGPDAELRFSGGITPYRGHEGYCRASTAFMQHLNHPQKHPTNWPVFGCQITSNNQ